jgi:hypothetical protein
VPGRAIGRALRWAGRAGVAGMAWLARYLIVAPARAIGWVLGALWRLRVPVRRFLYLYLVRPLAWLLRVLVWIPLRAVSLFVVRYLLRPLWTAVAATGRALRWTWRNTVVAAGRWVRASILAPAREFGRGVLVAFGLRRS